MEKRLMTFIACLFLSLGMALAQTQVFSFFKCYTYCGGIQPLSFHLQKY